MYGHTDRHDPPTIYLPQKLILKATPNSCLKVLLIKANFYTAKWMEN